MAIQSPLFSVIIPLFNKKRYILKAVDSVLGQTYKSFELIVVNDGSTDKGEYLISDHASKGRLHLINQLNKGAGEARNTGMQCGRGEWFAYLDADDFWLPSHLDELARIIVTSHSPSLISTKSVEMPIGQLYQEDARLAHRIRRISYFNEASLNIGIVNSSSAAIHRSIFYDVGGFGSYPAGEDLEYWARISLEYPCFISSRITSIYYRGTQGVMEQLANQKTSCSLPESLQEVSPSLSMLSGKINLCPDLLCRDDIRAYINSRLRSGMLASIRNSNPKKARAYRRLMAGWPADAHSQLLSLLSLFPRFLLKFINYCYSLYRYSR